MPPGRGPLFDGGLDLPPAPGLPFPPKLGLGFQPGFPPGRWPGPDSVRGGRAANEPSPSSRWKGRLPGPPGLESPPGLEPTPGLGVKDRFGAPPEGRPPGFHPTDEDLSAEAPDLLLGRGPPARGLPLLVVNGRARFPGGPPSERKDGREELGRPPPERPGPERVGLVLSKLGRFGRDVGESGRSE